MDVRKGQTRAVGFTRRIVSAEIEQLPHSDGRDVIAWNNEKPLRFLSLL